METLNNYKIISEFKVNKIYVQKPTIVWGGYPNMTIIISLVSETLSESETI